MREGIGRHHKNLITEIGNLMDVAGFSSDDIAPQIGLSVAGLVAKKKRNSFSVGEVKNIVRSLSKENVESYSMVKIMDAHQNEPAVSLAEFKTQMGWK